MDASLRARITELKKKRNAVILVHNYQPPEVQDIADFLGDSLDLSRKAAASDADVIVFCGVHFMAETAKILKPNATVLLPDAGAGCPMADMIDAEGVRKLKAEHPGLPVVAYVNTTAAVKAEVDVCCTSANAVDLVSRLPSERLIFIPDSNLGRYVQSKTGKQLILSGGYCPIHVRIRPEHIVAARQKHPGAEVLVHPECVPEVVALADKVLSTTGIVSHVKESPAREFVIGTEKGIIYRLSKENPGKKFHPACDAALCQNMNKTTAAKVLRCLEDLSPEITVPAEIQSRARHAIEKMLQFKK